MPRRICTLGLWPSFLPRPTRPNQQLKAFSASEMFSPKLFIICYNSWKVFSADRTVFSVAGSHVTTRSQGDGYY